MSNHIPPCPPEPHLHLILGGQTINRLATLIDYLKSDVSVTIDFAIYVLAKLAEAEGRGLHTQVNGLNLFDRPMGEYLAELVAEKKRAQESAFAMVPGPGAMA